MSRGPGKVQKKVLLLLLGGLTLGLSGTPKRYFKVLKMIKEEWKEIDRDNLKRAVRSLYKSKLISERENKDGTTTLVLTDEGREKALTYNIKNMEMKRPDEWDGYWRIVLYDIPEQLRGLRSSIRIHLKDIGFHELQKSVFVYPYECWDPVEFLVEHYKAGKYVRFIVADSIDNEDYLKRKFGVS